MPTCTVSSQHTQPNQSSSPSCARRVITARTSLAPSVLDTCQAQVQKHQPQGGTCTEHAAMNSVLLNL